MGTGRKFQSVQNWATKFWGKFCTQIDHKNIHTVPKYANNKLVIYL